MPEQGWSARALRFWSLVSAFAPPILICLGLFGTTWMRQPPGLERENFVRPAVTTRGVHLRRVDAPSARHLLEILDRVWGAVSGVPLLAPTTLPNDLEELSVAERKRVFLRAIAPHVLQYREILRGQRARLHAVVERLAREEPLRPEESALLMELAKTYRVELQNIGEKEAIERLLLRVDVIPASLALAQAAIESAWGTSRFALQGNNLFGQWVFSRDKGMVPLQRPQGANYSVARYGSVGEAVKAYLINLNAFHAYAELRQLRREMRLADLPLDPVRLAAGLRRYSTRGEEYVREIRSVIRSNHLTRFDAMNLVPVPEELIIASAH